MKRVFEFKEKRVFRVPVCLSRRRGQGVVELRCACFCLCCCLGTAWRGKTSPARREPSLRGILPRFFGQQNLSFLSLS